MDILDVATLVLIASIPISIWAYRHERAVLKDAPTEEQLDRTVLSRGPSLLRAQVLLFGLIQAAVGAILLLERLTDTDLISLLERIWPFLVVAAALTNTVRLAGRPLLMPLLLLFLLTAIVFYFVDIYLYDGSVYEFLWPLSLLIVGVWLAIAGADLGRAEDGKLTPEVAKTVVLAAARVTSTTRNLSLARITVFAGSAEVDLRGSTISPRAEVQIILILARASVLLPINTEYVVRRSTRPGLVPSKGEPQSHPPVLITSLQFLGNLTVTNGPLRRLSAGEQDR